MSIWTDIADFFTGAGKDVETVVLDLGLSSSAVKNLWGVCLGAAQIAELVDPAMAPIISAAVALATPVIADIEAGLATSQQLATLAGQAAAILIAGAPVVTVQPNLTTANSVS